MQLLYICVRVQIYAYIFIFIYSQQTLSQTYENVRFSGAVLSEQFLPRLCGLHLVGLRRHLRRTALRWCSAGPRGRYLRTEGARGFGWRSGGGVTEHLVPSEKQKTRMVETTILVRKKKQAMIR